MALLGPANFLWLDADTQYVHADRRRHETAQGLGKPQAPGLHMMCSMAYELSGRHACVGAEIEAVSEHMVLLASLPLSAGPWRPLAQGSVLAIAAGRVLRQETLAPAAGE